MKIYMSSIAIFYLFSLTASAKSYDAQVQICELGTSCGKCIETISVSFDVDEKRSLVFVSSKTPEGTNLREPLKNCEILARTDWSCNDLRGRVKAAGGHLTYTSSTKYAEGDSRKFDICLSQQQ